MLQGTWAGRVGGTGGYVWIDNLVYAEFTAYGALAPRTLTTLGVDPTGGPRFDGAAPYWRLAVEHNAGGWQRQSIRSELSGNERSGHRYRRGRTISVYWRHTYFHRPGKLYLGTPEAQWGVCSGRVQ